MKGRGRDCRRGRQCPASAASSAGSGRPERPERPPPPARGDAALAVVDYGGGNLGSLVAALERRHATFDVTNDPAVVATARAAILPGDGAFGATMQALRERELDAAIRAVVAAGRPLLGICVGMQLLYEASDERGTHAGFAFLPGAVARFEHAPRVPHMGWNELDVVGRHPFVSGVASGDYAYFLHGYRALVDEYTLAACEHGERFAAIVARDHIVGTQFHPEKSQTTGARLLDNFIALARA